MIALRKHWMGGYAVRGHSGEPLGSIKRKPFSPRFTIANHQGDIVGHTDICVDHTRDSAGTTLENTSYVLVSARSDARIATGLPAYSEDVDVTKLNTFLAKPPLADRMIVLQQGSHKRLFMRVKMDGSAVISGMDGSVSGRIQRLKRGRFSVDLSASDDTVLLCGIFLFARYLLRENEHIVV